MSYRHLSRCEREIIALRSDAGDKPSQIARLLNRHHITIRRELQRNGLIGSYDSRVAEEKAVSRRQQARHHTAHLMIFSLNSSDHWSSDHWKILFGRRLKKGLVSKNCGRVLALVACQVHDTRRFRSIGRYGTRTLFS